MKQVCLISFYLFLLELPLQSLSQGQSDTWCFGDSVTLNLQSGNFINLPSCNLNSIESSASISDSNGNLIFYAGGYTNSTVSYLKIFSASHQLIQNGDSIKGDGTVTNGLVILPFPSDTNKYYLFSIAPTMGFGLHLYYSIIDMSLNSGNGAVIQKNILLYNQTTLAEKLTAIKHGNGRDWWLITHQLNYTYDTDTFLLYLITPNGIAVQNKQNLGTLYSHNYPFNGFTGEIQPSQEGTKLLCVGSDVIDLFDFNRCTGTLSNYQNLAPAISPQPPLNGYYGCSFSTDGTKIYISNWHNGLSTNLSYQLFQLDLLSPNIASSKTIIFSTTNQNTPLGQHQLARNGKIYIASAYGIPFSNSNYVTQNMNLSVINAPDSLGTTSNFSSYSIPLGGRRSYVGLPNIPNYNLGADEGSPCDTLAVVISLPIGERLGVRLFPNPASNNFTISYTAKQNLRFTLQNTLGQTILQTTLYTNKNSLSVNTQKLSNGVYFYKITNSELKTQSGKISVIH